MTAPPTITTNAERAERAAEALRAYSSVYDTGLTKDLISDLVVDLRHLADAESVDWDSSMRIAEDNYSQEVGE